MEVIGRHAEVEALSGWVAGGRGGIVMAPAGMGKTAVVAAAVPRAGRPARWGAALDLCPGAELLAVQRALDEPLEPGPAAVARARHACRDAVLVIDDAQWLDPASLGLLEAVAPDVCLVLVMRWERSSHDAYAIGRRVGLPVLALAPLAVDDAADLIGATMPAMAASVRTQLARWAGGVPGWCLAAAACGGRVGHSLVEHLDPVLRPLSVLARRRLAAGSFLTRLPGGAPGVEELRQAGLVRVVAGAPAPPAGDGVELLAPLLGAVALERGDAEERRAACLWAAGEVDDPARAVELLLAAGAAEQAGRLARRVPVPLDGPERDRLALLALRTDPLVADAEVLGAASTAARRLGDGPALRWVTELVAALPDVRPGSTELLEAHCADLADDVEAVVRWCTAGLAVADDDDMRALLLATRCTAHATLMDPVPATVDATGALELVEGPAAVAASFLTADGPRAVLAAIRFHLGEPGWEADLRSALASAREEGLVDLEVRVVEVLVTCLFADGRRADALDVLDDADARHQLPGRRSAVHRLRCIRAVHLAFVDLAPDDVVAELAWLHQEVDEVAHGQPAAMLAVVLADRGQLAEADAVLATALGRPDTSVPDQRRLHWAAAEVALVAGDLPGARRAAARVLDGPMGPPAACMATLVAARTVVQASGAVGDLPPPPVVPAVVGYAGVPLDYEAQVARLSGDTAAARRLLGAAADAHDLYLRRWALVCRLEQARLAVEVGDRAEAADAAGRVLAAAGRSGLDRLTEAARAVLRDAGAEVPARPAPARPAPTDDVARPLTARQSEVLRLVGAGLSTAQIAAQLGVAPATVVSHVRAARRRLGATSRVHAAARLVGEGPVAGG